MVWVGVTCQHFLGCLESIPPYLSWDSYRLIYGIQYIV